MRGRGVQGLERIRGDGGARLGFGQHEARRRIQNEVDFDAALLAQVEERGRLPAMDARLVDLRRDPGLEDRAAQRVVDELIRGADAQEVAREPGVEEVQLGGLDHLGGDAAMPGGQAKDQEARLEDRQPRPGGVVRDAGVGGERGEVEHLRGSAGAQPQEGREGVQVADVEDLAHVALDVGGDVVGQPAVGGDLPVVDARIAAPPQGVEEVLRRGGEAPQLVEAERQEVQHAGSSRQGLRDGLRQAEVLRPGEDEPPVLRAGIDVDLEVAEQIGRVLDFVDDRAGGMLCQEAARVGGGELALVERFERHVRLVREGRPAQRGLAGLARPGHGDHRIVGRQGAQARFEVAWDHRCRGRRRIV